MVEIKLSPLALDNIQDIYDFISKDSPRYADKQIQQIFDRIKVLNTFPLSGKIVPEYEMEKRRELIEGNYRIVYQIYSETSIGIVTIHHHARLLE
jgi:addiction module RelE/StbE family toxin